MILKAAPDLARRVADEPGALAALARAAKQKYSARNACEVLGSVAKAGGDAQAAAADALLSVLADAAVAAEAAAHARRVLTEPLLSFSEAALAADLRRAVRVAELEAVPVNTRPAIVQLAVTIRGGAAAEGS